MSTIFCLLFSCLCDWVRPRAAMQAEILALRHQLLFVWKPVDRLFLGLRQADLAALSSCRGRFDRARFTMEKD